MTTTAQPNIADAARAVLESHPELLAAMLYGSAASGRMNDESDVDVAVLADAPLTVEQKIDLAVELGRVLHRDVDILDLSTALGTVFAEALCNGQRLFVRDTVAFARQVRRMQYNQADDMPRYRMILDERRRRFINGKR